jgi:NADH-quinone oxidoreductase subunit L
MELDQAENIFRLAPLLIGFPLLGLFINLIFGRRIRERWVGVVASAAVGLSFGVSLLLFFALQSEPEGTRVFLAEWINIGNLNAPWALKIDTLSVTMAMMVTGVSTLIHIYAIGYMHEDVRFQGDPGRFPRFFVYFNLFVASMMVLVTADNYLMMFVGWEGVGLCSYLLIGFWYEKGEGGIGNALAGKKAFITNRVGDFGFLIAMFLIFWTFNTLQFDEVFSLAEHGEAASETVLTAITIFMLLGVTGKSAQIPLYIWLPDAMAGPTPVSALIHAATMVTAGIFLIVRNHVLFTLSPTSSNIVALIGGATALLAATIAVAQFDIKRVLAYSTISQLGFMVAAVGLGAYVAGMFHLIAHAFFKALLFLSSGSVIQGVEHGLHHLEHADHHDFDPQDMRNMGGLRSRMKVTFWVYLVGGLALAGIPPLAGFFSKDEILADANEANLLVYLMLTVAAVFTAFYMGRQILMVFFGKPRSEAAAYAQESPPLMTVPLIALAALAVIGGALNLPGVHSLTLWLEHTLAHVHAGEFNVMIAALSTGLAIAAIWLAWRAYGRKPLPETDPLRKILGPVFTVWENKYWIDEYYDWLFVKKYLIDWRFWHDWFHDKVLAGTFRWITHALAMGIDLPVIDGAANTIAYVVQETAKRLRVVQSGYVRNYALSVLVGFLLVLSFILIR